MSLGLCFAFSDGKHHNNGGAETIMCHYKKDEKLHQGCGLAMSLCRLRYTVVTLYSSPCLTLVL